MTHDDHDDDTERQEETTGQGYPEESQPGMGIDAHEHAEDNVAHDEDAPETSPEKDGDPSQATGNPKAAGG
jgi:hypothetical protein